MRNADCGVRNEGAEETRIGRAWLPPSRNHSLAAVIGNRYSVIGNDRSPITDYRLPSLRLGSTGA
jgi:hypothetical protein